MNNEKKRPRTRGKGGRLPKSNPAVRRETVNLDRPCHNGVCGQAHGTVPAVPCHRSELQSGSQGVAHPFHRKESVGTALQT